MGQDTEEHCKLTVSNRGPSAAQVQDVEKPQYMHEALQRNAGFISRPRQKIIKNFITKDDNCL